MKETRTINLNGQVYHIDHDAYQQLRDYLHDIEMRLPQDDRKEVMEDLEARIAELFQKALFAKNVQVINLQMLEQVSSQIGQPADFGPNRRPTVKVNKVQNTGCGRVLRISLQILLVLMALPVLGIVLTVGFALIMAMAGVTIGLGTALPFLPELASITSPISPVLTILSVLCLVLLIGIPILMLIHTIVVYIRTRKGPKARFWWITILLWFAALVGMGKLAVQMVEHVDRTGFDQLVTRLENEDMFNEVRFVEPFYGIDVQGAVEVNITQSADQQLLVTSSALQQVLTEVRDSVLFVSVPGSFFAPVVLDIAVPNLSLIRAAGACEIDMDQHDPFIASALTLSLSGAAEASLHIHTDTLKMDAIGAAAVELSGKAKLANLLLAGAGSVDAEDLVAQSVKINCNGASEAEIYAVRELWAQAAGASKISYKGNPTIKQKMAVGGSKIKKG